jgi:hypothetical protein
MPNKFSLVMKITGLAETLSGPVETLAPGFHKRWIVS